MLHWLDTVSFNKLQPQTLLAMLVAEEVWGALGCWITSCNDGVHSGKPVEGDSIDPHYTGKAFDLRIKHIIVANRDSFVLALRNRLGPEYVVLHEDKGKPNEHVHVQYGHIAQAA